MALKLSLWCRAALIRHLPERIVSYKEGQPAALPPALGDQRDCAAQEFAPWLKWLIFEAVLVVCVKALASRLQSLQPIFEAVGWL